MTTGKSWQVRIKERFREGFREWLPQYVTPRPKRTPWDWAMEERRIGQGASPLSRGEDISYSENAFPWCKEPTNSAVDPDVTHTVLMFASAMGKTDGIVTNIFGWGICEEPGNMMSAWPIEAQRDKYSRDVIDAGLIDATPAVKALVTEKKSRQSGNTIAYKKFPGGSFNIVATGSPLAFRGPRVFIAHCAEVDGMGASVGREGDPVELVFKRCEGFARAVKIVEGTPTLSPTVNEKGDKVYRSRIQYWMERSDYRKWYCPCRDCGHLQVWTWEQIRWPKGHPELATLHCEQCDTAHNDRQRIQSVRKGRWIATAPFTGIRGYWINGINSLLPPEKGFKNKLHQFVADHLRAESGMEPIYSKRVWKNTFLCEVDNPEGEEEAPPDWKILLERREDYGDILGNVILPEQAIIVTASTDVQYNRLEVEWKAWAQNEESWGLAHVVLDGNTREVQDRPDNVWERLIVELKRRWTHKSGAKLGLDMCLIDSGWASEWIYLFMRRLSIRPVAELFGKVKASTGVGRHGEPIMSRKYQTIARALKGFHIGTWQAKDLIYQRLRMEEVDGIYPDGFMHYPMSYDDTYFQQLTSEQCVILFENGEEIHKYINPGNKRNEGLDLAVGNLGAFKLRTWNWEARREEIKAQVEAEKKPKKEDKPEEDDRRDNWIMGGGKW